MLTSTCIASLMTAGAAVAQTAAPGATAAQPDDADLNEVVVTGSRMRGVVPTGSTVAVVDQDAIVSSGASNPSAILAQVPSFSSLGFNEGSRSTQGGNNNGTALSAANLRGLGPAATLTLLNGHRLPIGGNGGYAVDLNGVPTIALDRVEVLADGASAIYGSDAVAGVVNMILRRNVNGLELSAHDGTADGYDEHRWGAIGGFSGERGQLTLAVERNDHTRLPGNARDYNRQNLLAFGGVNGAVTTCFPGNAVVNGVFYPIQADGTIGSGAPNTCEPYASNDILPRVARTNVASTMNLILGDRVTLGADAVYAHKEFDYQYAHTTTRLNVPQNNPFFQLPPGLTLASLPNCTGALAALKCLPVDYYIGGALGQTRLYTGTESSLTVHPELAIDLWQSWKLRVESVWGTSTANTYGYGNNTAFLTRSINSTDPTAAWDVFANRTNPAVVATEANYVSGGNPTDDIRVYDATLDGVLFSLPGGDLKLAVNGEYRTEKFTARNRTGPVDVALLSFPFARHITAGTVEANVPLVGVRNARRGIAELSLDVAGRYEDYSDFGSTSNPRVGVNWAPVQGLTFKSSYSTSFRAAGPAQLVGALAPTSVYFQTVDPLAGGAPRATLQINAPNPNLQPETSRSLSFAVDIGPELIPNVRATASFFAIDYKNVIQAQFNNPDILNQAASFASLITRNPTAAQIAAVTAQYPAVNLPTGPVVAIVDGRPNNLGRVQENGVDFLVRYTYPETAFGLFDVFLNGTYLTKYDVNATPTSPSTDALGTYGFPVRLRGRAGTNWSRGGWTASLFLNYVDSYHYNTQVVDSWKTLDLYGGYTFHASGWADNLSLSINVTNVTDEDPPFVNIPAFLFNPGGLDPAQANALGRVVSFNLRKKL